MLYLPAQSGKTGKMEELIKKSITKNKELGVCNFIISDNNLVLTNQTKTRITKDLATGDEEAAAIFREECPSIEVPQEGEY